MEKRNKIKKLCVALAAALIVSLNRNTDFVSFAQFFVRFFNEKKKK